MPTDPTAEERAWCRQLEADKAHLADRVKTLERGLEHWKAEAARLERNRAPLEREKEDLEIQVGLLKREVERLRERLAYHEKGTMRLRCYGCGKTVSSEVSDATVVRAVLWCPECIEAYKQIEGAAIREGGEDE
jgi:hypothetical protein